MVSVLKMMAPVKLKYGSKYAMIISDKIDIMFANVSCLSMNNVHIHVGMFGGKTYSCKYIREHLKKISIEN